MSDPNTNHNNHSSHTSRETHVTEKRSGSSMAFIVGGLVVAVAVIAWLFLGGTDLDSTGTATGDSDTNITVESPEASAEGGTVVESESDTPVLEPVDPAEPAAPAEPVEPETTAN
ncbi:hypothetical protein [Profundibacterium mesophilum]|uniref:Uncharacterized protein n=1 Tax=Profundibacterium mesophilum KAUST100406-0324 TaxID=1037889 RepID=A0A921NRV8_9RHOB|nr:hypothetical protein [Profundibacterium mesophilum]KAF0676700.1 hypothetical protein PMES_00991 [Profundibacterium mesophilum KAUST100406-0324]